MYKKLLFTLLFSPLFLLGNSSGPSTLFQQLKNLNKFWTGQENIVHLDKIHNDSGEVNLIQTHLLLVAEQLERKSTDHLTISQKRNRSLLLNELRVYANGRTFPINNHHTARTPYFIDDVGTACAVGQLIIKSGNKEFAELIAQTNNYDFIENMPQQTELLAWANEYGFNVEELKWIQPSYGPQCNPGQVMQPICKDGLGCFNPDWQTDGLISPVTYLSEFNDGTGWTIDSNNTWLYWGAAIGQHKITITDSTNASIVYQYTINNIPAIPIVAAVTDQSSGAYCNGKVSIIVNNPGTTTYYYELIDAQIGFIHQSTTGVFDSLCTGNYVARVSTSFNCSSSINVVVNNSTGLAQNNFNQYIKLQSPVQRYLKMNISLTGPKQVRIYTMSGALAYERSINEENNLDLGELENGLYLLQVEFKGNVYNRKIVKAN